MALRNSRKGRGLDSKKWILEKLAYIKFIFGGQEERSARENACIFEAATFAENNLHQVIIAESINDKKKRIKNGG